MLRAGKKMVLVYKFTERGNFKKKHKVKNINVQPSSS